MTLQAALAWLHAEQIQQFEAVTDPWEALLMLARRRRAYSLNPIATSRFVMGRYSHFLMLVARQIAADQDALLHAARDVFNIRLRTLRNDLKAAIAARVA
jgi:hypothetical protein